MSERVDALRRNGRSAVRVALYTHPSLFEPALCLAAALADLAEVHLLMEVPATNDKIAHFEAGGQTVSSGRVDGDAVFAPFYSAQGPAMWRRAPRLPAWV